MLTVSFGVKSLTISVGVSFVDDDFVLILCCLPETGYGGRLSSIPLGLLFSQCRLQWLMRSSVPFALFVRLPVGGILESVIESCRPASRNQARNT
jgi:hypothetical protein